MVSTIQTHLQETKAEQKEETARLLLAQHTAFSEAYKVLQDHMEESIVTEEVLRDWPTHYGQVYQQTRQTRQGIQALEARKSTEAELRQTVEEQIVMETNKLQKLEREAHQWVQQALPNLEKVDNLCPHIKRLLQAADEQNQILGPTMENIAEKSMSEKMSILSGLTTLTIDIEKALQIWTDFQHQLAITAPAIVEVCVQRRPTIRLHSPQQEQI